MIELAEFSQVIFPASIPPPKRSAAMLAAYLDESTDQQQKVVFAAGGFVGRLAVWLEQESLWSALLTEYGIEYFKASECEWARGQFDKSPYRDGEETDRTLLAAVQNRFLDIIRGRDLVGMAVAIDLKDFNEIVATDSAASDKLGGTPFYFGYHVLMGKIADEVRRRNLTDVVAFVCDCHEIHSEYMLKIHADFQSKNPNVRIGTLTYARDVDLCQLQAADLVTYELRKEIERQWTKPQRRERMQLEALKKSLNIGALWTCRRPCLEYFLSSGRVDYEE